MKNCCHFPLYWRGSLAVIVQFVLLVCEPSVVLATPLRTSLPTRIGLLENVVASKISSNLLKTPPRLTPTSIIVKGDGSVVVAGVSPATEVTVVGYDAAGREDWRTTIGNASSFNEVASMIESGSSLYIGGKLGKKIDEERDAGAFVARIDGSGDVDWITIFGSLTTGDRVNSIAADGGSVFAGGSAGSLSTIVAKASNSGDINVKRPLLVKLDSSTGKENFISTPTPQDSNTEEEITGLGIDARGTLFGVGRLGKASSTNAPLLYRFKGPASESTFKVKNGVGLADIATSAAAEGGKFYAVGGCYLHRVESSGKLFTVRTSMIEEDGKCIGNARGLAYRAKDGSVVVVTEQSSKPEILLLGEKTGSLVGRASGSTGQASALVGPALGEGNVVALAGKVGSSTALFVGGAIVARVQKEKKDGSVVDSNDIAGKNSAESNKLWVKVAAIGGSGAVVVLGILLTALVVQYTKRTGDPA